VRASTYIPINTYVCYKYVCIKERVRVQCVCVCVMRARVLGVVVRGADFCCEKKAPAPRPKKKAPHTTSPITCGGARTKGIDNAEDGQPVVTRLLLFVGARGHAFETISRASARPALKLVPHAR
jgi:hypothetical protein